MSQEAALQHHRCPQHGTEQLVPGRWSRAAQVWLSCSSGGLRQLHPLPRLQVPSIQGHVLPMPPAGFLQGPGCDLGTAVVIAPKQLEWGGQAWWCTWGPDLLKPQN